jgi:hypothetical protein
MNMNIKGKLRLKTYNLDTGKVSYTPWSKNLVMASDGYGINLIMRALANLDPLPLRVTKAKLGTSENSVTDSQTDLIDPTVDNIEIANETLVTPTEVLFEFFMPNFLTPDDTYKEFGVFCGEQMFSRVIIEPAFVKNGNVDTTAEYVFEISNVL